MGMLKTLLILLTFGSLVQCSFLFGVPTKLETEIKKIQNLNHVAIIADGNRRWAKEHGLPLSEGHVEGFIEVAPQLINHLWDLDIHTVTLWCCSIENLKREKGEVKNFLSCFEKMIRFISEKSSLTQTRIIHLGRKDLLPKSLQKTLEKAELLTQYNTHHILNLAIAYSGLDEVRRVYQKLFKQGIHRDVINEALLVKSLDTGAQPFPNPDLIIRTSGEQRIDGFMPLQTRYSELYFMKKNFPSVRKKDLHKAIRSFEKRRRTFSK